MDTLFYPGAHLKDMRGKTQHISVRTEDNAAQTASGYLPSICVQHCRYTNVLGRIGNYEYHHGGEPSLTTSL